LFGQGDPCAVRSDQTAKKANLVPRAESFAISSESGILSEQLATMEEKSMVILKEYITKRNAPMMFLTTPLRVNLMTTVKHQTRTPRRNRRSRSDHPDFI
jgi:hypothetical protein